MTRMSREFSLVLLGSGVMTAGHFLFPEPDVEAAQNEQLEAQASNHSHHSSFIWIHSGYGYGSSRTSLSAATGSIRTGGFGSFGRGAGA